MCIVTALAWSMCLQYGKYISSYASILITVFSFIYL